MKSVDWRHSGIEKVTGIDTDSSHLQEILLKSLNSTEYFAKTFMGDTFKDPMTYQHKDAWKLIDDETVPKVAICCYRGFGKTSMAQAKVIKGTVFRQMRHIMIVGATEYSASQTTESIRQEILGNNLIRDVFGWMKPDQRAEIPLGFSKKSYFLVEPKMKGHDAKPIAFIHPKGAGQSVRGILVRIGGERVRPDFIYIDDFDDDKDVLNEETRKENSRWIHGALANTVCKDRPDPRTNTWVKDPSNPDWRAPWRLLMSDTVKHEDAVIVRVMNSPDWRYVRYPQAEFQDRGDGKRLYSLVPDIVTHEQVRAEYDAFKKDNNLDTYYMEKLCLPMATENACWTRDMFKYYSEEAVDLNTDRDVERFIIVDPARTSNPKSCPSGILVAAADYKNRKVMLRHESNKRLTVSELLDEIFDLALKYNTKTVAVEITGLEDVARQLFLSDAMNRGLDNIDFVWLDAKRLPKGDFGTGPDAAKRARSSAILPYYQKGLVYHEMGMAGGALESQELSYPKSAGWDMMDCAGYIPKLLSMGGRFFEAEVVDNPFIEQPSFDDGYDWDQLGRDLRERARYI